MYSHRDNIIILNDSLSNHRRLDIITTVITWLLLGCFSEFFYILWSTFTSPVLFADFLPKLVLRILSLNFLNLFETSSKIMKFNIIHAKRDRCISLFNFFKNHINIMNTFTVFISSFIFYNHVFYCYLQCYLSCITG